MLLHYATRLQKNHMSYSPSITACPLNSNKLSASNRNHIRRQELPKHTLRRERSLLIVSTVTRFCHCFWPTGFSGRQSNATQNFLPRNACLCSETTVAAWWMMYLRGKTASRGAVALTIRQLHARYRTLSNIACRSTSRYQLSQLSNATDNFHRN